MSLSNTARSYGAVAKTFHWTIALLIITLLPLGLFANQLAYAIQDPTVPSTDADIARAATLFSIHKTLGLVVFFTALARILWAITQTKPGLLNTDKPLETVAAETAHWLLYGSMVAVPLSGWIHHAATTGFAPIWWPFGQNLPFVPKDEAVAEVFAGVHFVLVIVLGATLLAHIGGALKHFFIDRDFTLQRMLPGFGAGPEPAHTKHAATPVFIAIGVWAAALGTGAYTGQFDTHAAEAPVPALAAVQSDWQVQDGTLSIDVVQLGSTVSGTFSDWTAAITFDDPDQTGPAGRVDVTVAIGSLSLGTVTDQAMGPDFFDAGQFPTATFAAEITKTETGYEATGPLTIKGVSVPVTLPFDLAIEGNTATMTGQASVNRLDFNVGQSMQDESSVAFGVIIQVALTAKRS